MDHIFLKNYTVVAKHGYYKEEHTKPQRFIVSVTAFVDLHIAGHSDKLEETFNYELIRKHVKDILMTSPQDLVESLAEQIAAKVLQYQIVREVEVQIEKPDVWNDSIPGVVIRRKH